MLLYVAPDMPRKGDGFLGFISCIKVGTEDAAEVYAEALATTPSRELFDAWCDRQGKRHPSAGNNSFYTVFCTSYGPNQRLLIDCGSATEAERVHLENILNNWQFIAKQISNSVYRLKAAIS